VESGEWKVKKIRFRSETLLVSGEWNRINQFLISWWFGERGRVECQVGEWLVGTGKWGLLGKESAESAQQLSNSFKFHVKSWYRYIFTVFYKLAWFYASLTGFYWFYWFSSFNLDLTCFLYFYECIILQVKTSFQQDDIELSHYRAGTLERPKPNKLNIFWCRGLHAIFFLSCPPSNKTLQNLRNTFCRL